MRLGALAASTLCVACPGGRALRDFEVVREWINEYRPRRGGKLYAKDSKLEMTGDNNL